MLISVASSDADPSGGKSADDPLSSPATPASGGTGTPATTAAVLTFSPTIIANNFDGTPPTTAAGAAVTPLPLVQNTLYVASGAIEWVGTEPAATYTFTSTGNIVGTPFTTVTATNGEAVDLSVDTLNISTYDGAQLGIQIIDQALADIDANRATLGAVQNRFQHTIYNLQNVRENMMASRSRIEDTDYASEMATLTKDQVLKQASIIALTRANAMQQDVLTLLG